MSVLFQLSSKVLLFPELSEIIDRIVAILEVRSAATATSFINPRYTIFSVFGDLLIPLKLLTKISKSRKLFLPRIFVIGGARREELSQSCACSLFLAKTNEKDACLRVPQSSSLPQSCAKEKSSGVEIEFDHK